MWQSPLSTAIAASQGQANSNLLQQITMLHNLHQQQLPTFNYLQVAMPEPSTTNYAVVKQELSDFRTTPGFPLHSASNGSLSNAHASASCNFTSKVSSTPAPSPAVPLTNTATTSSPASKRPCFSPSDDSTQEEIQTKRNSPCGDTSSKCTQSQSSGETF
ncbi:hypothetical protein DICVIV_03773 [Dictyocaulus viviparus]|uniref:Uncharacterized protein n=1 Tax=Dictyocaulus viviparus TaxID=29172 RepID=A0A0D8Y1L3_DICVI|nr:hypothetical protein DICVIV_03773 [Dictyocaulus viviparus]